MKKSLTIVIAACLLINLSAKNLLTERKGHITKLAEKEKSNEKLITPPAEQFSIIKYNTELGPMSAYLSKHQVVKPTKLPAIIWLTGGFPVSSPGRFLWEETDITNEQSARIYRHRGIVTMFPLLRGRIKSNPGIVENFYGEVNDVISAAKHLKTLPHIDPNRIYLGGHSTGGTLALLVAESTDIFAGVISLGPVSDDYGKSDAKYLWNEKERYLRAPKNFLSYIKTPTYIIEGQSGNAGSLEELQVIQKKIKNPNIIIASVSKGTHFTIIHPINRIFSTAIVNAKSGGALTVSQKELETAYTSYTRQQREAEDLNILSSLRSQGILIEGKKTIESSFYAWDKKRITKLIELSKVLKFGTSKIKALKNDENKPYFGVTLTKEIQISNLNNVFVTSRILNDLADKNELYYEYWTISK